MSLRRSLESSNELPEEFKKDNLNTLIDNLFKLYDLFILINQINQREKENPQGELKKSLSENEELIEEYGDLLKFAIQQIPIDPQKGIIKYLSTNRVLINTYGLDLLGFAIENSLNEVAEFLIKTHDIKPEDDSFFLLNSGICNPSEACPADQSMVEKTFQLLLDAKVDPNYQQKDGQTILIYAIYTSHNNDKREDVDVSPFVKLLLNANVSPSQKDKPELKMKLFDRATGSPFLNHCFYPLELAIYYRQEKVCRLLLEHKADLTPCRGNSANPLIWALKHSTVEIFKLLFNQYQFLAEKEFINTLNELCFFSLGQPTVNIAGLEHPVKLVSDTQDNSQNKRCLADTKNNGSNASKELCLASADSKNTAIPSSMTLFELLLEHKADVNARNQTVRPLLGWYPLQYLAYKVFDKASPWQSCNPQDMDRILNNIFSAGCDSLNTATLEHISQSWSESNASLELNKDLLQKRFTFGFFKRAEEHKNSIEESVNDFFSKLNMNFSTSVVKIITGYLLHSVTEWFEKNSHLLPVEKESGTFIPVSSSHRLLRKIL